ncbi:MAG: hypothetical protein K6E49_10645 [Lachnospiraceae bacterium]|nr:hypothetical protein [Lachnospiraceae bacterium]
MRTDGSQKPYIRLIRAALPAIIAVLAAISLYQGIRNALAFSQDFQWDAAKALAMGLDPYELSGSPLPAGNIPELDEFYTMFTERGLKQQMEANQFPSLLMLLYPMTLFNAGTAKVLWCILNLLFTAGIILTLDATFFEKVLPYDRVIIYLLMIAGTPYRNQLGVGQHTLFAFFFFMLAVYIEKKKGRAGTVPVALCLFVSYFKYTLTAPLALYFVYKKRYAPLVISVAAHMVLTVVSAFMLKKSVIYVITAPIRVASALTSEGGIDLGVIIGGTAGYAVAFVIAILLLLISVRLPGGNDHMLVPVLVLSSLILTYHRTYDFFVLSVVAMLFYGSLKEDFGTKLNNALVCWYAFLLGAVYFGLRLFNENTFSKIITGVIYYAFTAVLIIMTMSLIKKGKVNRVSDNG